MHIILLNSRHGSARTIHLDLRWLLLSAALLLVLSLGAGAALGAKWLTTEPVLDTSLVKALDQQREQVGVVRQDAQRQLDAFAVHVAELQARLTRLDALGERLTELAELDAGEFDFSLGVGQGGAEDALGASAYAPPPFMSALDDLALRVDSREQQLEVLEQLLGERRLSEAETLSGRPVLQGYVSSPFGRRVHPLTGRVSVHKGIDFASKPGSDVVSVARRMAMATWWKSAMPTVTSPSTPTTRATSCRSVIWCSAARPLPRSVAVVAPPVITCISKSARMAVRSIPRCTSRVPTASSKHAAFVLPLNCQHATLI
jgi:hypothetical protein